MYYGSIKPCDIANGTGVRVTLFVSGCTHRCKGCFQPQTWDFRYGQPFTAETEEALLEALDRPYISGLTLLGGEPFEPDNQRALLPFLHRLRQQLPDKTVWAFSGYTWEELTGQSRARCEATGALLSLVDVLVDGEFVEALRDISLRFRGSSNQRLLDVPASLAAGRPVFSPQRPTSRLRSNAGPAPQWHLSTCHPAAARADAPRWAGYLSGGRRPRALRH